MWRALESGRFDCRNLQNGRASISLGYIGVHETINALFGTEAHVYDDAVLREKAVAIIKHLKMR